jgi:hypothetical protein
VRSDYVVVGADISNFNFFRFRAGEGKMEHHDAHARMELQDALELLPQEILNKMLPANRAIMLRRTSKTMRAAVENAKVDAVVVARHDIQFSDGNGLLVKLSDLNAWCKVINYLGEGGGQAIAEALRVNSMMTSLDLEDNDLGDGGGQALAEALRVNTTVTSLDLDRNNLGKDAG